MSLSSTTATRSIRATCEDCGFSSLDLPLVERHSCDVAQSGGRCEDFPCCGHESGDCNGLLYGSDEAIISREYARMRDEDGSCYDYDGDDDMEDEEDED